MWKKVWRAGVAPLLSTPALEALREGLANDDPTLVQGATCFSDDMDSPPTCACAVGYGAWKGDGLETRAEVELFFANVANEAEWRCGECAAIRWFTSAFDETPRKEMWPMLLDEVQRELDVRQQAEEANARNAGHPAV